MTGPLITADLVERCARAAHNEDWAGNRTWDREGDAYRDSYRTVARVVLEEALRPPPPPPVLDGQEPLI